MVGAEKQEQRPNSRGKLLQIETGESEATSPPPKSANSDRKSASVKTSSKVPQEEEEVPPAKLSSKSKLSTTSIIKSPADPGSSASPLVLPTGSILADHRRSSSPSIPSSSRRGSAISTSSPIGSRRSSHASLSRRASREAPHLREVVSPLVERFGRGIQNFRDLDEVVKGMRDETFGNNNAREEEAAAIFGTSSCSAVTQQEKNTIFFDSRKSLSPTNNYINTEEADAHLVAPEYQRLSPQASRYNTKYGELIAFLDAGLDDPVVRGVENEMAHISGGPGGGKTSSGKDNSTTKGEGGSSVMPRDDEGFNSGDVGAQAVALARAAVFDEKRREKRRERKLLKRSTRTTRFGEDSKICTKNTSNSCSNNNSTNLLSPPHSSRSASPVARTLGTIAANSEKSLPKKEPLLSGGSRDGRFPPRGVASSAYAAFSGTSINKDNLANNSGKQFNCGGPSNNTSLLQTSASLQVLRASNNSSSLLYPLLLLDDVALRGGGRNF